MSDNGDSTLHPSVNSLVSLQKRVARNGAVFITLGFHEGREGNAWEAWAAARVVKKPGHVPVSSGAGRAADGPVFLRVHRDPHGDVAMSVSRVRRARPPIPLGLDLMASASPELRAGIEADLESHRQWAEVRIEARKRGGRSAF